MLRCLCASLRGTEAPGIPGGWGESPAGAGSRCLPGDSTSQPLWPSYLGYGSTSCLPAFQNQPLPEPPWGRVSGGVFCILAEVWVGSFSLLWSREAGPDPVSLEGPWSASSRLPSGCRTLGSPASSSSVPASPPSDGITPGDKGIPEAPLWFRGTPGAGARVGNGHSKGALERDWQGWQLTQAFLSSGLLSVASSSRKLLWCFRRQAPFLEARDE